VTNDGHNLARSRGDSVRRVAARLGIKRLDSATRQADDKFSLAGVKERAVFLLLAQLSRLGQPRALIGERSPLGGGGANEAAAP
jgi:hypothetical protein